MPAATYNFTIEQGATFTITFGYRASTGAPINLTGFSARMHARQPLESSRTLINATTANGLLTIAPLDGTVTLALTATQTAALNFDKARYDLELEAGNGVVTRLVEGTITLSKEVTR
jgi:hypothetical protein